MNVATNIGAAPPNGPIGPAYRILTARLVIRCWNPDDAPMLKAAIDANTSHLRPWMPWATIPPASLDSRIAWLRRCRGEFDLGQDYVLGIFDRQETEVIGGTGLHTRHGTDVREIGYWIQQKHARQGYATEVTAALTRVAFEVDKVTRVEICCAVENAKSAGIPSKLGFVNEGILRKRTRDADGTMHDLAVWTMFGDEYPASLPRRADVQAYDVVGRRLL